MHRCSVIACARWESPYIREWLAYYAAIGVDHVYLTCNDDDPTALLSEVHEVHRARPGFVTFTHFPGQGQQRAMYLDIVETARAASQWLTFLDVDEFLVLRGLDDVNLFVDRLPADIDSVHFHWLNFGNNGFVERPAGSVLRQYTRRAATLHPNTKHLTRAARLDPVRLARADYPFWHALPDPVWSDLKRVDVLGRDMAALLRAQAAGDDSYLADPATNARMIATAAIHHYMMKSEKDFLLRAERGTGGEFAGQSMWRREYESGNYRNILASLGEVADHYLADLELEMPMGQSLPERPTRSGEPQPPLKFVPVQHRHWTDTLQLGVNGRVRHASHGSLGDYMFTDDALLVKWDQWPADLFLRHDETFVAREILPGPTLNLNTAQTTLVGHETLPVESVVIAVPGSDCVVEVRPDTSDSSVFGSVFQAREYAVPGIAEPIHTIVDLGANTGLASVFFALRHPAARIIAVEPELGNFRILCRNTRALPNILPVNAAIWSRDTTLSIETVDAAGRKIAEWGFQTTSHSAGTQAQQVEAVGVATLVRRYGLSQIDLLKVDVEGAELELFGQTAAGWLACTRHIVVETHERFSSGSDAAVTHALAADFVELPMSGENRVFARRPGAPLRPL